MSTLLLQRSHLINAVIISAEKEGKGNLGPKTPRHSLECLSGIRIALAAAGIAQAGAANVSAAH